jgi:endonuclease YncB( thermonuclease family)
MNIAKRSLIFTALLAFGMGVAACSSQPAAEPLSLKLSKETIALNDGTNTRISAYVNTTKKVEYTWTVENRDYIDVVSRDSYAMITALKVGSTNLVVKAVVDGGQELTQTCPVTVQEVVHVEVPLTDPHPDWFIDYAHNGSCQLALDYKGHDFFVDGVGEFDLWMAIDGDTAHFTPKVTTTSSDTVKARFYGIDTPESTGRIQPYGKQASNFTKDKLYNASKNGTIVLAGVSSEYGVPETDANKRHLCCVWINETKKNADKSELTNLNLWIIQEGYSDPGSLNKMPEYEEVFLAAFNQAKAAKLKKFSGNEDPLFPKGDFIDTDISDIMREVYQTMDDPSHENPFNEVKVRIRGTVVGFANNTLFLQAYDFIDDQYYGINCFCGMQSPNAKYTKVGNYLQVCGYAQDSENFGFQVTGLEGHFPNLEKYAKDDDVQIIIKAEDNVFDDTKIHDFVVSASGLNTALRSRAFLNSGVCLTDTVKVNYFNASKDEKKYTIGFEGVNFDIYLTTAYAGDPNNKNDTWTTEAQWMGKVMKVERGILTFHTTTSGNIRYQLVIDDLSKLIWVH